MTILAVTGLTARSRDRRRRRAWWRWRAAAMPTAWPQSSMPCMAISRGVISIGLAGALSPLLKVGDVVIADQIMTGAENWRLRRSAGGCALASRLPHAHQGPVVRQRCDPRKCRRPRPALYDDHRRAGGGHGKPGRGPLCRSAQPAAGGAAGDFRRCDAMCCRRPRWWR